MTGSTCTWSRPANHAANSSVVTTATISIEKDTLHGISCQWYIVAEQLVDKWLIEIVGFWTPDYLRNKLARLRSARVSNLILCIDEDLNCGEEALPPDARAIFYRRLVDPGDVLRIVASG